MEKVTASKLALQLNGNVVYVRFTKKNGEMREMICTRSPKWIPQTDQPTDHRAAKKVEDTDTAVPVFDLVIEEWRSVCPDSIEEKFGVDENMVESVLFNMKQERENT